MIRVIAALVIATAAWTADAPALAQQASPPAAAEEPSAEELEVARQVVLASGSGRLYDELLPNVAEQAKTTFIRANPQMQLGVIEVVDKVALSLVERRRDLDQQLAAIWAELFTLEELQSLLAFYQSPAGQKFGTVQPVLLGAQLAAARDWAQEIGEEMMRRVASELRIALTEEAKKFEAPLPMGLELKAE